MIHVLDTLITHRMSVMIDDFTQSRSDCTHQHMLVMRVQPPEPQGGTPQQPICDGGIAHNHHLPRARDYN